MGYCKVYFADVSCLGEKSIFDRFCSSMPETRKKKISGFRFEKDRCLSLGAGILVSRALSDAGLDVSEDDFSLNENGKPYLPGSGEFHFNLSHSGTKVMCAVSDREIGCDVEKTGSGKTGIAKRYFSEKESGYISGLESEEAKDDAFCRLWTLKESFIKATGTGLTVPLNSFSVDISGSKATADVSGPAGDYGFYEFSPGDGYRYSICICNDDGNTETMKQTVYFE